MSLLFATNLSLLKLNWWSVVSQPYHKLNKVDCYVNDGNVPSFN